MLKSIILLFALIPVYCSTADDLRIETTKVFDEWHSLHDCPDFQHGDGFLFFHELHASLRAVTFTYQNIMVTQNSLKMMDTETDKKLTKLSIDFEIYNANEYLSPVKTIVDNLRITVKAAAALQACDDLLKLLKDYGTAALAIGLNDDKQIPIK